MAGRGRDDHGDELLSRRARTGVAVAVAAGLTCAVVLVFSSALERPTPEEPAAGDDAGGAAAAHGDEGPVAVSGPVERRVLAKLSFWHLSRDGRGIDPELAALVPPPLGSFGTARLLAERSPALQVGRPFDVPLAGGRTLRILVRGLDDEARLRVAFYYGSDGAPEDVFYLAIRMVSELPLVIAGGTGEPECSLIVARFAAEPAPPTSSSSAH